jgi:hypothetical protein
LFSNIEKENENYDKLISNYYFFECVEAKFVKRYTSIGIQIKINIILLGKYLQVFSSVKKLLHKKYDKKFFIFIYSIYASNEKSTRSIVQKFFMLDVSFCLSKPISLFFIQK